MTDAPAVVVNLPIRQGPIGLTGPQGNPGGNVMSVGAFSTVSGLTVPSGTNLVQTSGGSRSLLIEDTTLSDASVTAYPLAITKTANGRYFRRDPRDIWVEHFGADPTGVADSTNALRAAYSYARFCARLESTYQSGSPTVRYGCGQFKISGAINLHSTVRTQGQSSGMEAGQGGTVILQTANAHIFIVNRADTNDGHADTPDGGADGCEISHLTFRFNAPGTPRGVNGPCAVNCRARVNLHDVTIEGMAGPGWQIIANVGGGGFVQGEASGSAIRRVVTNGCFIGGLLQGGDANVISVSDCTFGANDQWGLLATQFLSSTFINNHFKGNGSAYIWSYGGSRYSVVPGQEAAASTTVPGTNANVWSVVDSATGSPAWTSGGSYAAGGAVAHTNRNARSVFLSNYFESGQGLPMIMYPAMSIGGQWAHATGADGVFLGGEQGIAIVRALSVMRSDTTNAAGLDPATGLTLHNGTAGAVSDVYFGPRSTGYRCGIGQGDSGTTFYISGATEPHPGYLQSNKIISPGPFASNAAAVAAGLIVGQIYGKSDGTVAVVI